MTQQINPGIQSIWEGALIRIAEACQPEADRVTCQASLQAYKLMAWGAFLATLSAEAQLVHRLIQRAEQDYWEMSPTMQGLEAWAKDNSCT